MNRFNSDVEQDKNDRQIEKLNFSKESKDGDGRTERMDSLLFAAIAGQPGSCWVQYVNRFPPLCTRLSQALFYTITAEEALEWKKWLIAWVFTLISKGGRVIVVKLNKTSFCVVLKRKQIFLGLFAFKDVDNYCQSKIRDGNYVEEWTSTHRSANWVGP